MTAKKAPKAVYDVATADRVRDEILSLISMHAGLEREAGRMDAYYALNRVWCAIDDPRRAAAKRKRPKKAAKKKVRKRAK
jgi:hypothetical protein